MMPKRDGFVASKLHGFLTNKIKAKSDPHTYPHIGHPDRFANLPAGCFRACSPLGIDPVTEAE